MTAAGVGGELILIPIVKVFFKFNSVNAIALSQICTMVSSLIRLSLTFKNRNPHRDAPEIEYDVAMIFLPSMFLGSNIGLVLSYIIPNVLSSMLLIVVLLLTTYRTLILGINLWKQDIHKNHAKFYTNSQDVLNFGDDSDEEYIHEDVEEISLSSLNDNEIRHRQNHKLDTTLTTVNEERSSASKNLELFPLENIIENEK